MEIPALSAGLQGIQAGMDNMRKNANDIAQAGKPDMKSRTEIADSLVNLKNDSLQVQASTKVVNAVDQAIGSLFDERV